MNPLIRFVEGWWWLALIFGGGLAGSIREAFRRHHDRRLAIIEAKAKARAKPVTAAPPEPQPVCGCTHHLSFHNPKTSVCAFDGCRCQQYVGPEPLGHVIAMPLVDPETMGVEPQN
ncbi:MAG TPA: hypothetical protein VNF47_28050 [Streptosporangiaceae bacterium]|nr:hypothetical protein [Streptosporangiaceae bacterium]